MNSKDKTCNLAKPQGRFLKFSPLYILLIIESFRSKTLNPFLFQPQKLSFCHGWKQGGKGNSSKERTVQMTKKRSEKNNFKKRTLLYAQNLSLETTKMMKNGVLLHCITYPWTLMGTSILRWYMAMNQRDQPHMMYPITTRMHLQ
jgi:hypothetical protein